jgi:hypothetical protein
MRAPRAGRRIGVLDLAGGGRDLEPAATSAAGGFDRERVAVLGPEVPHGADVSCRVEQSRDYGNSRFVRGSTRLDLVAGEPQGLGRRSDPRQARARHRLGEAGVLGQEAVAGMHRLGSGFLRRADDSIEIQVRVCRRDSEEVRGFIRDSDVARPRVYVRVHRDRRDA